MTGYQALYRKYRPQTFKDLAGQDPIADTLRNEVRDDRLAHAYLFTGPRGTGKTTSARLLAKALNCQRGPTPDPCPDGPDECGQCKAVRTGSHLDVVEIDAASNRGIDDIRSLQERVHLAPVQGRYKVFIIDEVHMLTDPAWNALLKTLEEPPPRCVFVLATTEVHKVLATVLSRCQRFDFQRIARPALVARLRHVATIEGISVSGDALEILARRADGGLRDALSLLDQVAATTSEITAASVCEALGMLPAEEVARLGQRIADRDPVGALETAYALLAAGHDHRIIVRELLGWARDLMLLQLAPDKAEALDIPAAQVDALRAQLSRLTQADLLQAIEILRETDQALRGSNQLTVWLEVGLLRLCDRASVPALADLARRVADLEARLGSAPATAAPTPVAPHAARGPAVLPTSAAPQPAPQQAPRPAPQPAPQQAPQPSQQQAPAPKPAPQPDPATPAPLPAGDQDVYPALLAAIDQPSTKSKSAAFKQYVLTARRKPGGTVEIRTRKTTFYKEGGEQRRFLHEQVKALYGPDTGLEVVEDPGASRGALPRQSAPPAPAAGPRAPNAELQAPSPGPQAPSAGPQGPAAEPRAPSAGPPSRPAAGNGDREAAAGNGAPRSGSAEGGPPRSSDSADPVGLAREIFLGKIVDAG